MATQYATLADLIRLGVPNAALAGISDPDRDAALLAASGVVDSYVGERFKLPLTRFGDELRRVVCKIAAHDLITTRGLSPGNDSADTLRLGFTDSIAWLKDVSKGLAKPQWPANSDVNDYDPEGESFVSQPTPGTTSGTPQTPKLRSW